MLGLLCSPFATQGRSYRFGVFLIGVVQTKKKGPGLQQAPGLSSTATHYQWNCSSSVEPVSAVTDDAPPWITVVMSSK